MTSMESRFRKNYASCHMLNIVTVLFLSLLLLLSFSVCVSAEDTGLPDDYQPNESDNRDLSGNTGLNRYGIPWHQYKNILTNETVDAQNITVLCEPDDDSEDEPVPDAVDGLVFRLYNSTTQETECEITSDDNGVLHMPPLKRGHTYILMAVSDKYIIKGAQNIYLWALGEGDHGVSSDGAYEHKKNYIRINDSDPVPDNYLDRITEIIVRKPGYSFSDPMYYDMHLPVIYDGQPAPDGIKFRLTSAEDGTVETVTQGGYIDAALIEDNDYTVHVDDDRYDIDTFALAVKDKSEHKYKDTLGYVVANGRYCYDHTCCQGANEIVIRDRSAVTHDGRISSLKTYGGTSTPQTTVTGMDFKTLLLLVRYPDTELPAGTAITDYDTVELTLANPHRWEKCKITDTEFTIKQMLPQKRTVKNVYQLREGSLEKLSFSQSAKDSITFTMDTMSLYPVVIEYAATEPVNTTVIAPGSSSASKAHVTAPKGTKIKKIKAGKKKFKVTWKKQANLTSGYQIQYGTKKNFKKAKTAVINKAYKTSKTIKKLKSRKRYYVRIRTFRIVNGDYYYSAWSKTKTVKVR